jgi:hypothetical protein
MAAASTSKRGVMSFSPSPVLGTLNRRRSYLTMCPPGRSVNRTTDSVNRPRSSTRADLSTAKASAPILVSADRDLLVLVPELPIREPAAFLELP